MRHKHKNQNKKFWNKEYSNDKDGNLAISTKHSADLEHFLRWYDKYNKKALAQLQLESGSFVYDIGCGNGRNLIYLAEEFGMKGRGFDVSVEGIETARKNSKGLELEYGIHEMGGVIDLPDNSVDLVLDMMASHFLDSRKREQLRHEIVRILKPSGWLFYKTFLRDGDINAQRLLRRYPANEKGTYIHPNTSVEEHVSSYNEIVDDYSPFFKLHKALKSHNHIRRGKAHKRRSISVYCENLT